MRLGSVLVKAFPSRGLQWFKGCQAPGMTRCYASHFNGNRAGGECQEMKI